MYIYIYIYIYIYHLKKRSCDPLEHKANWAALVAFAKSFDVALIQRGAVAVPVGSSEVTPKS